MDIKKVKPIVITDSEKNEEYTLEFSRATVVEAEENGFTFKGDGNNNLTDLYGLWKYSFLMHHKDMGEKKINEILDEIGGLTNELIERLADLYGQAVTTLYNNGEVKNSRMTVKL